MRNKSRALDICQIAMGAIVITVCAWITIPTAIPFTLQTLGIFTVLQLFGGRKGFLSICLYILMGLIGIPVFSGFSGGPAALVNVTGGYLVGFIIMALVYWFITNIAKDKGLIEIVALIIGLLVCYIFGSIWLAYIYGGSDMLLKAFGVGVLPFVLPDAIKLILSRTVAKMVGKHIRF